MTEVAVYDFLRDQGSLIAGLLAFVAGILAYGAGRTQAKAVQEQNAAIRRSERRQLARSSLVAVRLLDGVLTGIDDCLKTEENYIACGVEVSGGDGQHVETTRALDSRKRIQKPALHAIWEQLGQQDSEWIKNYMALDRQISMLWSKRDDKNPSINSMLADFRILQSDVKWLRDALTMEARRANDVLAEV